MIEIRDLTKTYRVGDIDVHALRGVNLSVAAASFCRVVGPSGSGKSTLFNILGGLTPPTSGTVHIDGRDLLKMTDAERTNLRKKTVGFVFQKYNLLPTLDRRGQHRNRARHRRQARPRSIRNSKKSCNCSASKAACITSRARFPAASSSASPSPGPSSIAPRSSGRRTHRQPRQRKFHAVLALLRDLNKRLGQTILMITHDPEAAAYGHRMVNMRDGRIVCRNHPGTFFAAGVYAGMFEQSVIDTSGRRSGALAASVTAQTIAVGIMILIPLLYNDRLPLSSR